MAGTGTLSQKQRRFIAGLMGAHSVREAAAEAGIGGGDGDVGDVCECKTNDGGCYANFNDPDNCLMCGKPRQPWRIEYVDRPPASKTEVTGND